MKNKLTKQDLIDFEKDIFDRFNEGKIKSAIHLSGGNEDNLIEIFEKINSIDWVFSTHRNHYHSLLKSQNPEWVKQQIMDGNSMHINSEEYKIFTSSIVGGIIPIALGTALGIKKNWDNGVRFIDLSKQDSEKGIVGECMDMPHVWCFVGDMASQMGCFNEALRYAVGHDLPITFVIEDNDFGVYTNTEAVYGTFDAYVNNPKVIYYNYERVYPHHGIGKYVKELYF